MTDPPPRRDCAGRPPASESPPGRGPGARKLVTVQLAAIGTASPHLPVCQGSRWAGWAGRWRHAAADGRRRRAPKGPSRGTARESAKGCILELFAADSSSQSGGFGAEFIFEQAACSSSYLDRGHRADRRIAGIMRCGAGEKFVSSIFSTFMNHASILAQRCQGMDFASEGEPCCSTPRWWSASQCSVLRVCSSWVQLSWTDLPHPRPSVSRDGSCIGLSNAGYASCQWFLKVVLKCTVNLVSCHWWSSALPDSLPICAKAWVLHLREWWMSWLCLGLSAILQRLLDFHCRFYPCHWACVRLSWLFSHFFGRVSTC